MFTDSNVRTFIAGGTISKNRLVLTGAANTVIQNTLASKPDGLALNDAVAGEPVAVRMLNCGGTVEIETEAAVADNATVYARANGLCDDSSASSAVAIGKSLGSASGAGVILEVLLTAF